MLNFIRNCLKRNVEGEMEKQRVTYTVVTEVSYSDPGDWKRKVRAIRKTLKTTIAADKDIKILKIENKQD